MASKDEQIVDLEIQAAHQGRMIEELSDELVRQGKIIDLLERKVALLVEKTREVDAGLGDAPEVNVKPPHW